MINNNIKSTKSIYSVQAFATEKKLYFYKKKKKKKNNQIKKIEGKKFCLWYSLYLLCVCVGSE